MKLLAREDNNELERVVINILSGEILNDRECGLITIQAYVKSLEQALSEANRGRRGKRMMKPPYLTIISLNHWHQ